ncbi:MAG: peptide chain release factor N(5)-glutamine methyltransferase [Bdellovibrionota bacterium]
MNIKEILDRTTGFFREKKMDSPRLDAELLLSHGLGLNRIDLYLKFEQPLKEEELQKLRTLVKRRAQGEPVAYILGEKDFFGETFIVNQAVLIPRPETEGLVETALNWQKKNKKTNLRILDLGCGSGCIGLSLLKKIPDAQLLAVDVSEEALQIAKKNADNLEVSDRVSWLCADAFDFSNVKTKIDNIFTEPIDLLVANPPYIDKKDLEVEVNVKMYEPNGALFSDENGTKHLKSWSTNYATLLAAESLMLMEMGYLQGAELKKHFIEIGKFDTVEVDKDLAGKDRIIRGECHG